MPRYPESLAADTFLSFLSRIILRTQAYRRISLHRSLRRQRSTLFFKGLWLDCRLIVVLRYKSALREFYAKLHAHPVAFEVGRLSAKGGHAHVQVVPVPTSVSADEIAENFTSEGNRLGIDFEVSEPGANVATSTGDRGYFKIDLPDGRKMVHWLKDGVPFSIQFGR